MYHISYSANPFTEAFAFSQSDDVYSYILIFLKKIIKSINICVLSQMLLTGSFSFFFLIPHWVKEGLTSFSIKYYETDRT